jgi:hypothetical protein
MNTDSEDIQGKKLRYFSVVIPAFNEEYLLSQ